MDARRSLVAALLEAPVGAIALAALDASALSTDDLDDLALVEPTASSVVRAAGQVRNADFFDVMAVGVRAIAQLASSYEPEVAGRIAHALRDAPERRSIADAIVERFNDRLHEPLQRPGQHWWWMYDLAWWSDVEPSWSTSRCSPGMAHCSHQLVLHQQSRSGAAFGAVRHRLGPELR